VTTLDVLAILVGAALGRGSGALKAQLHSLRRPQASLRAGDECRPGLAALKALVPPPGASEAQDRPGATTTALPW
jgi:hypothetical protein